MRVAVTGANGFVGRHAIARLLLGGHEVRALISERPGAEKELPGGGTNVDVRRADVRKPESLRGSGIERSFGNPPIAAGTVEKDPGNQCTNARDNQKRAEPSILLKPVHGSLIGFFKSRCSS